MKKNFFLKMSATTGIVILLNVIVVIFIIVAAIFIYSAHVTLKECQSNQSDYCYTIQCPGETTDNLPCKGYAQRPGSQPNTFYCSYAAQTLVDASGNAIL